MKSQDLLDAGWTDITGSFAERDRFLDMQSRGEAIVRRLHDGWFGKQLSSPDNGRGAPLRARAVGTKPETRNRNNHRIQNGKTNPK